MKKVKIYSTPTCTYCKQAKAFFKEKGIAYEDVDVSENKEAAQEMMELTGQMTVPVIVIDGEVIKGFDQEKLEEVLGLS